MRIPSFEIRAQRSIALARCDTVPSLMIIAGPNGAGKSTLLNVLRTVNGADHVLYVGPHRAMRRQSVQQRHLLTTRISLEELLSRMDVPNYEGIWMAGGVRDPWSSDDSANYLKHSLCQVEIDRQQAITTRVDRDGEIRKEDLIDPWSPLKELTHNLLPHLSFVKIDASDRNAVRCLWRVHLRDTLVDFDELSSGEKSIIQMFYPLVEYQIRGLLSEIERGPQASTQRPEVCVLIDEPELHLHPNLQLKVLDYLRSLTTDSNMQVILATHSPTMVEHAEFAELFLLRPIELVGSDENQLVQVATNEERLRFLREVFGGTSNLTTMQPIIIVEGTTEQGATKATPDRKLYRALHPSFDRATVIAGGGKNECRALLATLNQALQTFSPQLQAIALLDRDTDTSSGADGVRLLPVAMIENLMLDPDTMWEAMQSVIDKTPFEQVADVAAALDAVLDRYEPEEVALRARRALGTSYFRPKGSLSQIGQQAQDFVQHVAEQYSEAALREAEAAAQAEVNGIRVQRRRREEFHGKEVLGMFYKEHLHSTGLSKAVFIFETARHARRRKAVRQFFDQLFEELLPSTMR